MHLFGKLSATIIFPHIRPRFVGMHFKDFVCFRWDATYLDEVQVRRATNGGSSRTKLCERANTVFTFLAFDSVVESSTYFGARANAFVDLKLQWLGL